MAVLKVGFAKNDKQYLFEWDIIIWWWRKNKSEQKIKTMIFLAYLAKMGYVST